MSSPKYERKILDIPTPFSEVLILWIRAICRTKISSPDPELATGWPPYQLPEYQVAAYSVCAIDHAHIPAHPCGVGEDGRAVPPTVGAAPCGGALDPK